MATADDSDGALTDPTKSISASPAPNLPPPLPPAKTTSHFAKWVHGIPASLSLSRLCADRPEHINASYFVRYLPPVKHVSFFRASMYGMVPYDHPYQELKPRTMILAEKSPLVLYRLSCQLYRCDPLNPSRLCTIVSWRVLSQCELCSLHHTCSVDATNVSSSSAASSSAVSPAPLPAYATVATDLDVAQAIDSPVIPLALMSGEVLPAASHSVGCTTTSAIPETGRIVSNTSPHIPSMPAILEAPETPQLLDGPDNCEELRHLIRQHAVAIDRGDAEREGSDTVISTLQAALAQSEAGRYFLLGELAKMQNRAKKAENMYDHASVQRLANASAELTVLSDVLVSEKKAATSARDLAINERDQAMKDKEEAVTDRSLAIRLMSEAIDDRNAAEAGQERESAARVMAERLAAERLGIIQAMNAEHLQAVQKGNWAVRQWEDTIRLRHQAIRERDEARAALGKFREGALVHDEIQGEAVKRNRE